MVRFVVKMIKRYYFVFFWYPSFKKPTHPNVDELGGWVAGPSLETSVGARWRASIYLFKFCLLIALPAQCSLTQMYLYIILFIDDLIYFRAVKTKFKPDSLFSENPTIDDNYVSIILTNYCCF
jgi:hypothetical protein